MPDWLGFAIFVIVGAQLLSALAFLILVFAAPRYAQVALNLFGFFLAIRCATFALLGLIKRKFPYRRRVIVPSTKPVKFWGLVLGNMFGAAIGVFLIQMRFP